MAGTVVYSIGKDNLFTTDSQFRNSDNVFVCSNDIVVKLIANENAEYESEDLRQLSEISGVSSIALLQTSGDNILSTVFYVTSNHLLCSVSTTINTMSS